MEIKVKMKESKYVLFGLGVHCRRLLTNFPGLGKYIYCFLDSYSDLTEYQDIPVYKPEVLDDVQMKKYKVIISGTLYYDEIYELLINRYKMESERILPSGKWLAYMLKSHPDVKLCPTSVSIETCTLCQLDCVDCYMRKSDYGTMGKGTLSLKKFKGFIDKNRYIRHIEISNNGEPFLNPELKEILRYAYANDIQISIGNGTNLNNVSDDVLEELVKCKVSHVNVSIDGASQEIYEMYRRKGDFNQVISNIKKLNSYKRKYESEYPYIYWQYVLMEHNECDVEKAKKLSEELEMKIFYKLSWDEKNYIPKDCEKMKEITGLEVFNRRDYTKQTGIGYLVNSACSQIIFSPQINWDGRLLGCCSVFQSDWNMNVFENDFLDCINSEKYRNTIICMLSGDAENTEMSHDVPCSKCRNFKEYIEKGQYLVV